MYPKISIITPSLNQGKFLEETINSVISQNYPNLDYIIVDGGSSDNSIQIIKKYEKYLSYWISEKDNGQGHAINKGIGKSSGEILSWLNSDDILAPNALFKVSEIFIQNPDIDVIYGNCYFINEFGEITKRKNELSFSSLAIWSGFNIIPQPSSFFKKNIFDKIGLVDENLHFVMDFDLNIRFILNKCNIKYFPVLLSYFRWHEKSKSTDKIGDNNFYKEKQFLLYNKYFQYNPFNTKLKKRISNYIYKYFRLKRLILSLM
jgi:glycosyltransferase involved in cell wall biosynthesis